MGNEQSVEAPRRPPNKLTKPRTNSSTPNIPSFTPAVSQRSSRTDLSMSWSKRSSTLQSHEVAGQDAAYQPPLEKQRRRLSFLRPKSSQQQASPQIDKAELVDVEDLMPVYDPLHRYSQLNSVSYDVPEENQYLAHEFRPLVRNQRTSTYIPYTQQPSRLSQLVEIPTPEPSPEQISKQLSDIGEHGSFNRRPSNNSSASPSERTNSDPSITYPMRRRSLLVPGVATRDNSVSTTNRKSISPSSITALTYRDGQEQVIKKPTRSRTLPSEHEIHQYYYGQSKSESPPLERLAGMEAPPSFPVPPRTSTPTELDYGHLGSFNFGSLRITNGTASPTPDLSHFEEDKPRTTGTDERGSALPDKGTEGRHRKFQDIVVSDVEVDEDVSPISPMVDQSYQYPPMSYPVPAPFPNTSQALRYAELSGNEPLSTGRASSDVLDCNDIFRFSEVPRLTLSINPESPTRAYDMAQEYMQEIASSPFSFEDSRPGSPERETTSNNTASKNPLSDNELSNFAQANAFSPAPTEPYVSNDHVPAPPSNFSPLSSGWSRQTPSMRTISSTTVSTVTSVTSSYGGGQTSSIYLTPGTSVSTTVAGPRSMTTTTIVPSLVPRPSPLAVIPTSSSVITTDPTPMEIAPTSNPQVTADTPAAQDTEKHLSKPLAKTDSGYSSRDSVKSAKSKTSVHEDAVSAATAVTASLPAPSESLIPPVPDQNPPPTPPKPLYSRNPRTTNLTPSTRGAISPLSESGPITPPKDQTRRSLYGMYNIADSLDDPITHSIDGRHSNEEFSRPPFRQAPPVPLKHSSTLGSVQTGQRPPTPNKTAEQLWAASQTRPPVPSKSTKNDPTVRQSMAPTHETYNASDSDTSTSSKKWKRKLIKQRPASHQPVIVQSYYEIPPERVPDIPEHQSAALDERLRRFPNITHTYRSLQHTNSRETLATILSVGSGEQAEAASVFSRFNGSIPDGPSNEDVERFVTRKSVPVQRPQSMVVKLSPRKSTDQNPHFQLQRKSFEGTQSFENMGETRSQQSQSQEDFEHQITSLDAVSGSLGASPYDVASIAAGTRSHSESQNSVVPCNEGEESRYRAGLNSPAAPQTAQEGYQTRDDGHRRSLTRRQSYEGNFNDRGGIPGKMMRPMSMFEDVPPIPSLHPEDLKNYSFPKKAKSPPPVSMLTQGQMLPHGRVATPPVEETPDQNQQVDPWETQRRIWNERRTSAGENMRRNSSEHETSGVRKSFQQHGFKGPAMDHDHSAPTAFFETRSQTGNNSNSRPKLEQNHASQPDFHNRQSFRSTKYQPPFQTQQTRDSLDASRAGFPPSPLSESQTHSQTRAEPPLTIDRYSGGFGYGLEPNSNGYGLVGSAGMRTASPASRKGVAGSQLWGVDLSDVPIIVRSDGVEV